MKQLMPTPACPHPRPHARTVAAPGRDVSLIGERMLCMVLCANDRIVRDVAARGVLRQYLFLSVSGTLDLHWIIFPYPNFSLRFGSFASALASNRNMYIENIPTCV